MVGSILLALVAARDLLTGGPLHGGALLPAPAHLSHWWGPDVDANHLLGTGSAAPAAAYVLPLAVGGTVAARPPGPGWSRVLFLLSVPLAALSALRSSAGWSPGRVAPLWGAVAYGLLPVDDRCGRTGPPRHGGRRHRAALGRDQRAGALGRDRRRPSPPRSVWRTALVAAVLTAFVPVAWLLGLLVAVGGVVVGDHPRPRTRATAALVGGAVVAPLVVAVPFLLMPVGRRGSASPRRRDAWLVEAGRVAVLASLPTGARPGDRPSPGVPATVPRAWIGRRWLLVAGLVAGFARGHPAPGAGRAWTVAALAARDRSPLALAVGS